MHGQEHDDLLDVQPGLLLGQGREATVYRAIWRGSQVALKVTIA